MVKNVLREAVRKVNFKTLYIILTDFITHFLIILMLGVFGRLVLGKIGSIDLPESIAKLTEQQVMNLSGTIQSHYYYFIFLISALLLSIILVWTISRGVVWKLSLGGEIKLKYVLKSIPLGFIWFGIGMIPTVLIFTTFKPELSVYLLLAYLFVFIYYSIIIYLNYSKSGKINIFSNAMKEGTKRWDIALAFVVLALVYYVLSQVLNMIIVVLALPGFIITLFIYLLYFAFSRYYFIELYKKRG